MKMCEDGHDEIVYDLKNCPLCDANSTISTLEYEVSDLHDKITDLKDELDNARTIN